MRCNILENHNKVTQEKQRIEMSDLSTSLLCSACDEQDGTHVIHECERFIRPQDKEAEASKDDTCDAGKHPQSNSNNYTVHCGFGATNQIVKKHLQSKTLSNSGVKNNPDDMRILNESFHDEMAADMAESGYGSLLTMSSLGLQSPPIKINTESDSMKSTCHASRHNTSCHNGFQDFDDCSNHSESQHPAGQEQLDIVSGLKSHEPALMDKIFSNLTAEDLVRYCQLSNCYFIFKLTLSKILVHCLVITFDSGSIS